MSNAERIGALTTGDDSPDLNAVIRGLGKTAIDGHDVELIGFRDGVRGLAENRCLRLGPGALSGTLTIDDTIPDASHDEVHRMHMGGKVVDAIPTIKDVVEQANLNCLIMLGGGSTARNALRLSEAGIPMVHLPGTISHDVAHTDNTFGSSTALEITTDAIDRLHSTAHSYHRMILAEIMGHKAGWLALSAGIAGGADVILIPKIPYSADAIAETIRAWQAHGINLSVAAVTEGTNDTMAAQAIAAAESLKEIAGTPQEKAAAKSHLARVLDDHREHTFRLARSLEGTTGLGTRVIILDYVQRGGTPYAEDRLLGLRIDTATTDLIADEASGVMVASEDDGAEPANLKKIAGNLAQVPPDHPWIQAAHDVEAGLGD